MLTHSNVANFKLMKHLDLISEINYKISHRLNINKFVYNYKDSLPSKGRLTITLS